MRVVLVFVVSLMVTVPLQRSVIQPLRQLTAVADRSSLRNNSAPLPKLPRYAPSPSRAVTA